MAKAVPYQFEWPHSAYVILAVGQVDLTVEPPIRARLAKGGTEAYAADATHVVIEGQLHKFARRLVVRPLGPRDRAVS